MNGTIDIFRFHRTVMDQYQSFSKSFLDIDDERPHPAGHTLLAEQGRVNLAGLDPRQGSQRK